MPEEMWLTSGILVNTFVSDKLTVSCQTAADVFLQRDSGLLNEDRCLAVLCAVAGSL